MAADPQVIVFDVNQTLSDLGPMADRFADVGLPAQAVPTWFGSVLRDGFALSMTGTPRGFAEIGKSVLRGMLAQAGRDVQRDEQIRHVLDGFGALPVHPDVAPGITALADSGRRLVTLTNGAAAIGEGLLQRAGVGDRLEAYLSVADAPAWKPDPRSYLWAAEQLSVQPAQMMLVAVHPWDIHGAREAGLQTAYVDRDGGPTPDVFGAADRTVTGIDDLAAQLG